MNTHVIETGFARTLMNAFYRLSRTLNRTMERHEERRIRREAEQQLRQMDPRLLRDIGYDRISGSIKNHAQY